MTEPSSVCMRMVVTMPDKKSALTNCVYVSPDDMLFPIPDNSMVMINHFVWKIQKHQQVHPGTIALNSSQRMCARVVVGDVVKLDTFGASSVNNLEPIQDILYELLHTEGHVVDGAVYNEWDLMSVLAGHVVTEKQIIVFDYEAKNWRMRIKKIKNAKGQEIFRGIVAPNSHA